MKEILLGSGHTAIIDNEDEKIVSDFSWYFMQGGNNGGGYAWARKTVNGKRISIPMHRLILGLEAYNSKNPVDHINGNGLDNRRCNIRVSTNSQNQANRSAGVNNTSGFKGVRLAKGYKSKPWRADIKLNGKRKFLGYYSTPKEAAYAYNKASETIFGEFSRLNRI